jgi:galactosylgalactosylxylosylprotein 3-beta-glucuronosyltransferase 3
MNEQMLPKILIALGLFMVMQLILYWSSLAQMGDDKMSLEAEVQTLARKRDSLLLKVAELEREQHRGQLRLDKLDLQLIPFLIYNTFNLFVFRIRDLVPLTKNRLNMPMIFFVTPTKRRPTQKADLIRLHQTLSYVPNLYWILVEDAQTPSPSIDEILARTRLKSVHLVAPTPSDKQLHENDPNWILPRGVVQRNTALGWIRSNFGTLKKGVVYLGDDDNVYDWKLFDHIRSIDQVGVWPVGLVGGLLVETPILSDSNQVIDFNAAWKKERPFPIDMAAFSVNISLVNTHPNAEFSYNVSRGYQVILYKEYTNFKIKYIVGISFSHRTWPKA